MCAYFVCIIYTDVEGVFTTDPNKVSKAKKINKISYEEMLELASQGAKVLQTRSVELAMRKNTKLSVRSSFKPKKIGTMITDEKSVLENNTVSGITYSKDEAKITLSRVQDKPGVSSKIFGPLAKGNINVDMILQNISQDGKFANLSFTLPRLDLEKALKILKKEKSIIGYKKIISSTLLRKYLQSGKLNKVNKLLNRKWSIDGKVIKGRQLGKKIGVPTANIDIKDYVLAKPGVYAVKVLRKNNTKHLKGIANLGYRPTFNQKKILLEVHLFNFSGNLYNKLLSVEFLKFIRKEKKFNHVNQSRAQIKKDLNIAKKTK